MSVDPQLRTLQIDIPAKPAVLVRLSQLLAEEALNQREVGALVSRDMALAAALMKAMNSSLYGLAGRVQSVQQALTYLGTTTLMGIAFEMGLRASFPPSVEIEPLWQRAAVRAHLMAQLAAALGLDAWCAHSAGLFEECGKAALFRHAPQAYRAMLRDSATDADLCDLERRAFGVSHDALGAALCDSWGLAPAAVASVRHHVDAQGLLELPAAPAKRSVLALSVLAQTLMTLPGALEAVVEQIAPQADLDTTLVLRAARKLALQLREDPSHALVAA